MNLRNYIYLFPRGKRVEARKIIGDVLGVSEITIKSWENGTRKPRAKYASLIENITSGKVTRSEIRPDVFCEYDN